MRTPPNPANTNDPRHQQAAEAHQHRAILRDLIDLGAHRAREIHHLVMTDPANPHDAALAFEHVTRAIRRAILLDQKLARTTPPSQPEDAATRTRILRDVGAAMAHTAAPPRRKRPGKSATRPTAEIIADICRDVGLAALPGTLPDQAGTPKDILTLCAQAARLHITSQPGHTAEIHPLPTP